MSGNAVGHLRIRKRYSYNAVNGTEILSDSQGDHGNGWMLLTNVLDSKNVRDFKVSCLLFLQNLESWTKKIQHRDCIWAYRGYWNGSFYIIKHWLKQRSIYYWFQNHEHALICIFYFYSLYLLFVIVKIRNWFTGILYKYLLVWY